ncbi:MAG: diacylglycerol kinase family protein [Lewinellaceae bacterium]|nr:diacylglycerol kinase family protein [Lewinellaceae bacterium]
MIQPTMSLQRRIDSFRYALRGVVDLVRSQVNAQIHLAISVGVLLAGFWLDLSRMEWVAIVLCMALVLALEAVNTALEYLTDLVSPGQHPLAGKAKDVAAAAVLLAAIGAAVVGLIIFLPKLYALVAG